MSVSQLTVDWCGFTTLGREEREREGEPENSTKPASQPDGGIARFAWPVPQVFVLRSPGLPRRLQDVKSGSKLIPGFSSAQNATERHDNVALRMHVAAMQRFSFPSFFFLFLLYDWEYL